MITAPAGMDHLARHVILFVRQADGHVVVGGDHHMFDPTTFEQSSQQCVHVGVLPHNLADGKVQDGQVAPPTCDMCGQAEYFGCVESKAPTIWQHHRLLVLRSVQCVTEPPFVLVDGGRIRFHPGYILRGGGAPRNVGPLKYTLVPPHR